MQNVGVRNHSRTIIYALTHKLPSSTEDNLHRYGRRVKSLIILVLDTQKPKLHDILTMFDW